MRKFLFGILMMGLLPAFLSGQEDSILLSKNFKFKNGVFLSFEEFQLNQPTFDWKEVKASYFTNPQTMITQVASIAIPEGKEQFELPIKDIYALSIGGIPYVRFNEDQMEKTLPSFVALKVRGKICYFTFPTLEKKQIPMHAYNPKNGLPFRSAVIEREEEVHQEKIMLFETGEIKDFTTQNLLAWIQDDAELLKTIESLSPSEFEEKRFKCLLIYDDRNSIYLREEE